MTEKKKEKGLLPRTFRDQIDAIAMAICLAIGLKFFLVEAYEIPTPSMQPTLMGSAMSGVHDRILVNKAAWLTRKPQRFDIAVFRYPHNRSQNYVKRIWGLGGEHLSIIGGDIHRIHDGDTRALDRYECLAKPDGVQAGLWRTIYDENSGAKKDWVVGTMSGRWNFVGDELHIQDTGRGAQADFKRVDLLKNIYQQGYPESIIEKIEQEAPDLDGGNRTVADLRWSLEIQPDEKTRQIQITEKEIYSQDGNRSQPSQRLYRLTVDRTADDKAKARLEILEKAQGGGQAKVTASVDIQGLTLTSTESFHLQIVKVDGRLSASVAGQFLGEIEIAWKTRPLPVSMVSLQLAVKGAAKLHVLRNHLERDIFYTSGKDHHGYVTDVRVPEGHCWMLGDNTQNSADGRAWKTVTVRLSDEGKLLDLDSKEGRLISGNQRFHGMQAAWPPDPDENPVVVPEKGVMVFTDLWGEEHVIRAGVHDFEAFNKAQNDFFVPEQYVIGRAFATFWPAVPWGQFRLGLIR